MQLILFSQTPSTLSDYSCKVKYFLFPITLALGKNGSVCISICFTLNICIVDYENTDKNVKGSRTLISKWK